MNDLPRVRLLHLREYRSGTGATYFLGWLGDAKVVMRRDPRAPITGREVARWSVEVEQRQPTPATTEPRAAAEPRDAPEPVAAEPTAARTSPAPKRRQSPAGAGQVGRRAAPRSTKRDDAAAADVLKRHGIDPASPVRDDDVPW